MPINCDIWDSYTSEQKREHLVGVYRNLAEKYKNKDNLPCGKFYDEIMLKLQKLESGEQIRMIKNAGMLEACKIFGLFPQIHLQLENEFQQCKNSKRTIAQKHRDKKKAQYDKYIKTLDHLKEIYYI